VRTKFLTERTWWRLFQRRVIVRTKFLTVSVPDEGYSRDVSLCVLNFWLWAYLMKVIPEIVVVRTKFLTVMKVIPEMCRCAY